MTDTPRVFLAAYHDGLSPRYEVVPEGAMGAEPWVKEGAGVRVKALIFSEFREGGCIGRPHPFQYFITQAHNGLFLCHWDETWHNTLTNAQDHAQKDYQRAALELTTDPGSAELDCPDCGLPHPSSNPYCFCRRATEPEPTRGKAEVTDEMVWAACHHTGGSETPETCKRCPEWEDDPDLGKVQRMCHGIAREACDAVLAAMEASAPTSGAYDLICCTAEDVATGRGFTGDAAADLAMAQESLRDCLKLLGWRG